MLWAIKASLDVRTVPVLSSKYSLPLLKLVLSLLQTLKNMTSINKP